MDSHQLDAIRTTVQWIQEKSSAKLTFDEKNLLLFSECSPEDKKYFYRLALKAQQAAAKEGRSSFLAGGGNETDETGDVAFYIGIGEFAKAENAAKALGLDGKITMSNNAERIMDDWYSFRIENDDDSRVIFVQIGELDAEGGGWGGLLGTAIWT